MGKPSEGFIYLNKVFDTWRDFTKRVVLYPGLKCIHSSLLASISYSFQEEKERGEQEHFMHCPQFFLHRVVSITSSTTRGTKFTNNSWACIFHTFECQPHCHSPCAFHCSLGERLWGVGVGIGYEFVPGDRISHLSMEGLIWSTPMHELLWVWSWSNMWISTIKEGNSNNPDHAHVAFIQQNKACAVRHFAPVYSCKVCPDVFLIRSRRDGFWAWEMCLMMGREAWGRRDTVVFAESSSYITQH